MQPDPNQPTLSPEMPAYNPPEPKPRTAIEIVKALTARGYYTEGLLEADSIGGWVAIVGTESASSASSPVRALRLACKKAEVEI